MVFTNQPITKICVILKSKNDFVLMALFINDVLTYLKYEVKRKKVIVTELPKYFN